VLFPFQFLIFLLFFQPYVTPLGFIILTVKSIDNVLEVQYNQYISYAVEVIVINRDYNVNKTMCFSGHKTEKLPEGRNEFNLMIQTLIYEINKAIMDGYDTFMFGACHGFDLICAEHVLMRKKIVRHTDPINIRLIAVVAFEGQASRWKLQYREKYFNVLAACDEVITLNKQYHSKCYHERNRYMVDNSSRLICYYDGSDGGTGYTVEYAKSKSIDVANICNYSRVHGVTNKSL